MKSVFLFLCFVVLTLTSQGQNFPRLDLSDNGHVIELDGDEYYFLMRARVDRTFDAREAIFQINDWLEARSYMWLFAVDFEMKSSSDLEGFFVFEVQPNQGSDMRRCVFPSLLSNGYLEIHQYPPGIIPREYTLGGDCSCYYPGRIVKLTLNGSEEGVDYELLRGGIKVSTLSGTGGALTFRATNAGTYTVRAVRGEVSRSMNGSVKLNESPVFGGRLSLVNPNPVVIPPDGGHAEIPFSFTGSASEIIPLLQEVAVSCCSGESSYWNSSFLFACGQTGTNTGKFIVVAGPNLSDTDLESRFVLDTQATYGILELVQPNGGMLRSWRRRDRIRQHGDSQSECPAALSPLSPLLQRQFGDRAVGRYLYRSDGIRPLPYTGCVRRPRGVDERQRGCLASDYALYDRRRWCSDQQPPCGNHAERFGTGADVPFVVWQHGGVHAFRNGFGASFQRIIARRLPDRGGFAGLLRRDERQC